MQIDNLNISKHPALILCKDIAEICRPIFTTYNYCIMNFIRLYDSGNVLYLCDNYDWLLHYLKNGYPAIGAFEQDQSFRGKGYVLWNSLHEGDQIVTDSREIFNIKHGITLIQRFSEGYDFFNFGVSTDSHNRTKALITQYGELSSFIQLFYESANFLINKVKKAPFYLENFKLKPFLNQDITKVYLGPTYDYKYLTAKEVIYIKKLLSGMTIPEIAQSQHLSIRTIEKHIENIKLKLNCKTQCELGYKIARINSILISCLS